MREIDAHILRKALKRSLEELNLEICDSPPPGLDATLNTALDTSIYISTGRSPTLQTFPLLESINLNEGPDRATSTKIRNALIRPMEWLDIGWKAAGVATAIPTFGAWAAVGLLLVIRDLIKVFSIHLTLTQGQILHILADAKRQGESNLSIPTIVERTKTLFGAKYELQQLRDCLIQLAHLKCIELDTEEDTARIVEEIRF
jgi:hypothetical protein